MTVDGGAPDDVAALADSRDEQLRRTVIAWSLVATQASSVCCGISTTVSGCTSPGGLNLARVAAIPTAGTTLNAGARNR